eukprot:COSAG01_NODE_72683_length_252_cov_0.679739_1_plen_56_part_10
MCVSVCTLVPETDAAVLAPSTEFLILTCVAAGSDPGLPAPGTYPWALAKAVALAWQ